MNRHPFSFPRSPSLFACVLGFVATGFVYVGCGGGGGGALAPKSCLVAGYSEDTTTGEIVEYWYDCYDLRAPSPRDCESASYKVAEVVEGESCADLGYTVECSNYYRLHECSGNDARPGDRVAGFPEGVGFDPANPDQPDAGANNGAGGASADGGNGSEGGAGGSGGAGSDVENHINAVGDVIAEQGTVGPKIFDKLRVSDSGNCAVFLSLDDWTTPNTTARLQAYAVELASGDAEMLSVDANGEPANLGASFEIGAVNVDGLVTTEECDKVVFTSSSALDPVIAEDPIPHAYLRDRAAGTTVALDGLLAEGGGSAAAASITPDGSEVAYICHDEEAIAEFGVVIVQPSEIFHAPVSSLSTPQWYDPMPSRIYEGPLGPEAITIAAGGLTLTRDAQYVAFVVSNPDVLGLGTNQFAVVRGDLLTGTFELASNEPGGALLEAVDQYVSASGDGRYIAFKLLYNVAGEPAAGLYLRDLEADTLTLITKDPDGQPVPFGDTGTPQVTGDGRYVIFSMNDTAVIGGPESNRWQVYRYDIEQDTIQLITRGLDGLPSDMDCRYPGANYDGTLIAFFCDTNAPESNLTTVTAPEFGMLSGIFTYRDP